MTWQDKAKDLLYRLNECQDVNQQILIIAANLQSSYEEGIGDGIGMEARMRVPHDS